MCGPSRIMRLAPAERFSPPKFKGGIGRVSPCRVCWWSDLGKLADASPNARETSGSEVGLTAATGPVLPALRKGSKDNHGDTRQILHRSGRSIRPSVQGATRSV